MAAEPDRADESRRAASYLALVVFIGGTLALLPFSLVASWPAGWRILWSIVAVMIASAAVLAVTFYAKELARRTSDLLFSGLSLTVVLSALVASNTFAWSGHMFIPFTGVKLLMLVVALVAPSSAIGAAIIVVAALGPMVEGLFFWPPDAHRRAPPLEPWLTVALGLVALGVLARRRRDLGLTQELFRIRSERKWMERSAHLALLIRDLTNSPLQTLSLDVAVLRQRLAREEEPDNELLYEINGAVSTLRRLNEALLPLDRVVAWHSTDVSFDALARIEAEVQEHLDAMASGHVAQKNRKERGRDESDPRRDPRRALLCMGSACAIAAMVATRPLERAGVAGVSFVLAALGVLGVLFSRLVTSMSRAVLLGLFALEAMSLLAGDWITNNAMVTSGTSFAPFGIAKVTALLVAVFEPSALLSVALIALATVLPIVQTSLWTAEARSHLPAGEPWVGIMVGIGALTILWAGRKHARLARDVARIDADRAWLERVARLSLVLRDFTRAPLKTLSRGAVRVRAHGGSVGPLADRMEHAVARIERLNEALAPLDSVISWRAVRPGSDAATLLEEEVREHVNGRASRTSAFEREFRGDELSP